MSARSSPLRSGERDLADSGDHVAGRVCAVVVTYNRGAVLRACLAALEGQTRPPDHVLVVDNASTDGTRAMVREAFPRATVLALPRNIGGAGGFHAGMRWAYGQGFDWLWVMDDDARPEPDCLARLLAHARPGAVLVPVQRDSGGRVYGIARWRHREVEATAEAVARKPPVCGDFLFRFVGPLVAREVVGRVGLPNKEFFIWFDDIEYALRVVGEPRAQTIVVPDAVVAHDFGGQPREVSFLGRRSIRSSQPPWKLYYGARNTVYTITRIRRNIREFLLYVLTQIRHIVGDIIYEPDRWQRVSMRLWGLWHGVAGRLGKWV